MKIASVEKSDSFADGTVNTEDRSGAVLLLE